MGRLSFAEYIWLDGCYPVQGIRSKSRVVEVSGEASGGKPAPEEFPAWSFDGSSTEQASGDDSDCLLQPVRVFIRKRDPKSAAVAAAVTAKLQKLTALDIIFLLLSL